MSADGGHIVAGADLQILFLNDANIKKMHQCPMQTCAGVPHQSRISSTLETVLVLLGFLTRVFAI